MTEMTSVLAELEQLRIDLATILRDAQSGDLQLGWERLDRWKDRSVRRISTLVSSKEAARLRKKQLGAFSMMDPYGNFRDLVELYDSYMQTLIEEVKRDPGLAESADQVDPDRLETSLSRVRRICERFHIFVKQLRQRHDGRPGFDVDDEYDVQDLLHALVKIQFDDIRPEEWTPSYAGGSARMDFLLKAEKIVVEAKKTRKNHREKQIGEELLIDIAKYAQHADCRSLVCFIYDPEGFISNPTGFRADLEKQSTAQFRIVVIINPT